MATYSPFAGWLLGLACLAGLSGCGGGGEGTTPVPPPVVQANRAPTISGTAVATASAGAAYSFLPSASDADGDTLSFSISGKPAWASFSVATGALTGTPTAANAGTFSNIIISVSDGKLSTSLAAFSIQVTANAAPTISGTPAGRVTSGVPYQFVPTAADADRDTLSFSISGKPAWASFSAATGALGGTPSAADAGTYSNIVISVNDGKSTTSLPAFSIQVSAAAATGSAVLTWTAPTQNADGTPLANLAGYYVLSGPSADSLTRLAQVSGGATTTYTATRLASGQYFFAVAAYNSAGVQSELSNLGFKEIP